jgi:hypothetical protein
VRGTLVVGGPAPGAPRPAAGIIQVQSTLGGDQTTADTDASGSFVAGAAVHPTVTCDIR